MNKNSTKIATYIAVTASLAVLSTTILTAVMAPQAVYAPAGSRGMFCGDLPDAVRGAAPGESDGAICWCDDGPAMEQAAAKFYGISDR